MHSTVVKQRKNLFGPQCPHCQEPIMANHLFCRSCGASQIVPEFDRAFCPFCGLRVSKRQEFCHECCGYLVPEETIKNETKHPPFLQRCSNKFGRWGIRYIQASLIVGGLVFASITYLAVIKTAIVAISFCHNENKPPSQGIRVAKETGPYQSLFRKSSASLPSPSARPPIQTQLTQMLNQIRKAQLKKDINLFMSSFSPYFDELEEKRQKVLRIWQSYDFVDMNFEIQEIRKQDKHTASVKIYWQFEVKNKNTDELKKLDKTYSVSLSKEGDKWLIKDM